MPVSIHVAALKPSTPGKVVAMVVIQLSPGSAFRMEVTAASNRPVMTFYIRGGSRIVERVPLGNFRLKYATGQSWCDDDDLFGDDTVTNKADDEFLFYRTYEPDGYTTTSWTVELIQQRGGNLRTSRIPRNQF